MDRPNVQDRPYQRLENCCCASNLKVILLWLASHDDVERFVWVLGARLNAARHVLLILVGVQPDAECS